VKKVKHLNYMGKVKHNGVGVPRDEGGGGWDSRWEKGGGLELGVGSF